MYFSSVNHCSWASMRCSPCWPRPCHDSKVEQRKMSLLWVYKPLVGLDLGRSCRQFLPFLCFIVKRKYMYIYVLNFIVDLAWTTSTDLLHFGQQKPQKKSKLAWEVNTGCCKKVWPGRRCSGNLIWRSGWYFLTFKEKTKCQRGFFLFNRFSCNKVW